jgi:hypothetical protein
MDEMADEELDFEDSPEDDQDAREMRAVKKWLARIEHEQDVHEDFRDEAEDAEDATEVEENGEIPTMWGVVQVQHSACYSGTPVPDARDRSGGMNPNAKQAADVIQSVLEYYTNNTALDDNIDRVVDDYLTTGIGIPRVKLSAEISTVSEPDPMTGELVEREEIGEQKVYVEHVPWSRFGWEPCANWEHVEWIYFEHAMTRSDIRKRWGEEVEAPLIKDDRKNRRSHLHRVYEVWDKSNREVLVITEGSDRPLEVTKDPLHLKQFFPIPQPIMTNVDSDELVPAPDYCYVRPLINEINRLNGRSRAVAEQIKACSLHDSSLIEITDFASVKDGQSIPVDHLSERMEGGPDIRKLMYFWPIEERVQALAQINQQLILKRAQVDELLGISDILRGSSNPQDGQETQKIKERWAGIRLRRKQVAVQRMIRDLFRMMAELTVEHITIENLSGMTQMQITPEVYQSLQSDSMRCYAITIETDSTIAKDEFNERNARTDLLSSLTGYVQAVAPAVAQNMISADIAKEMLTVAVEPYRKYSRSFDDAIESMPNTQQQLQGQQQQIQQLTEQTQTLQQQLDQANASLQQYSQSEDQRQNIETQGRYAKDSADAQSKMAKLTDDQVQEGETRASTILKLAQAGKAKVETELAPVSAVAPFQPEREDDDG